MHRLVTTKYNPARTLDADNAVGIGAHICAIRMEDPGYQLFGRTIQCGTASYDRIFEKPCCCGSRPRPFFPYSGEEFWRRATRSPTASIHQDRTGHFTSRSTAGISPTRSDRAFKTAQIVLSS